MEQRIDEKRAEVASLLKVWRNARGKWASFDFRIIQAIVLTAQMTSVTSSILVAFSGGFGPWSRFAVAVLSAVPAFCISLDKSFNFPLRHRLNGEAHYQFRKLLSRLENGADPFAIESEFIDYQIEFEKRFPSGSIVPYKTSTDAPDK